MSQATSEPRRLPAAPAMIAGTSPRCEPPTSAPAATAPATGMITSLGKGTPQDSAAISRKTPARPWFSTRSRAYPEIPPLLM